MLQRLLRACRELFVDTYRTAEAQAAASRQYAAEVANDSLPPADRETVVVLLTAALSLTFFNYAASSDGLQAAIRLLEVLSPTAGAQCRSLLYQPETAELARLVYWSGTCLVAYVIIPILAIKLLIGRPLSEYGLAFRGVAGHAWIYGAMFTAMVPAVIAVSFTAGFQAKYPFYRLGEGESLWPYFACWEVLYALQFIGLEFFFRGFMVHGTRRRLGYYSVLVMTIPYAMLHFQKPPLETLGAIAAGVVLGTLSLKTRSIWWGAGLHIGVAYTMDCAALVQKGLL